MDEIIEENVAKQTAFLEGKYEGKEEGIRENQREMVQKMLDNNLSPEEISKYIGLNVDEIKTIINE